MHVLNLLKCCFTLASSIVTRRVSEDDVYEAFALADASGYYDTAQRQNLKLARAAQFKPTISIRLTIGSMRAKIVTEFARFMGRSMSWIIDLNS